MLANRVKVLIVNSEELRVEPNKTCFVFNPITSMSSDETIKELLELEESDIEIDTIIACATSENVKQQIKNFFSGYRFTIEE